MAAMPELSLRTYRVLKLSSFWIVFSEVFRIRASEAILLLRLRNLNGL